MGIARAIVLEPEVLFLDEPTTSVNQENTKIIEILIKLKKTTNSIIVIATRDASFAKRVGDFLLLLKDYKLEYYNF
jgi:tungstate transport system ATP-binding protein